MYAKISHDIKVEVQPVYLEDQSKPEESVYVWAYQVRIHNMRAAPVQLINRHWKITDERGRMQEVFGAGVVGEQPVLKPGETFTYTSGTPLSTPSGVMMGAYEMENKSDGAHFFVEVPAFSLDSPFHSHILN